MMYFNFSIHELHCQFFDVCCWEAFTKIWYSFHRSLILFDHPKQSFKETYTPSP